MNPSPILCREGVLALDPRDFEAVLQIETLAYEHPWSDRQLRESFRIHQGWGLYREDRLLGYAFLMPILEEYHLLNLTIAPAHQGRGWGTLLLREIKDRVRQDGATSILLEVRASHRAALRLYQTGQFEAIGIRRGYYPSSLGREDALVMRCTW